MSGKHTPRRKVIKSVGAAGFIGLAGCIGGGDGGDGGGDGSGGGDGDGGGATTGGGSTPTLRVNLPPWGMWNLVMNHVEEEGILEQKFDEAGSELELQRTWQSPPLYAGGKIDVASISPLEAAQIAAEQEIETVYVGQSLNLYQAFMTYQGSGYEVSETGSPEATWEKLVEDNARVMISGWDSGTTQAHRIVIENQFGYQFNEENADVRVVTADLFALPQLLAQEEGEAGDIGFIDGGLQNYIDGGVYSPIYMIQRRLLETGYGQGAIPINGVAVTQDAIDNNEAGVAAYVEAFDEGYQWLHENVDSIASNPATVETLDVPQSQEQVQLLLDGIVKTDVSGWENVPEMMELEYAPIPERVIISDSFAQESSEFLNAIKEFGLVAENWDEYMSYKSF